MDRPHRIGLGASVSRSHIIVYEKKNKLNEALASEERPGMKLLDCSTEEGAWGVGRILAGFHTTR